MEILLAAAECEEMGTWPEATAFIVFLVLAFGTLGMLLWRMTR